MITHRERERLEKQAARLPTIEEMTIFLHRESGKPIWICKIWANLIAYKHRRDISEQ